MYDKIIKIKDFYIKTKDSGFITVCFEESLCHRGRSGFIVEIVLWSCGRGSFST